MTDSNSREDPAGVGRVTRRQQRDKDARRQLEASGSTMESSKGPLSLPPARNSGAKPIGSLPLSSPIRPTADPASIEGLVGFLDLPGEIRNIIYKLVFKGAKFKVSSRPNPRFTNSDSGDEAEDAYLYIARCFSCTRTLLQTCKSIRAEAPPILSDATKLIVYKIYERRSPIHQIPSVYIRGIKSLEVEVNAFIWVPRECLPALEWICLDHNPNDEFGQIEHLASYAHGEQEQQHLITVMTAGIQDWKWKCKQFLHFAEEEN